jgi:hypothetical protein
MPRPLRLPSYRFHKASSQAIVVIRGKSHYLGPWNSPESRAEYDRLIVEWLANGRNPSAGPKAQEGATVDEVLTAFWRHAEAHYRSPDGSPTFELVNFWYALRPLHKLYGHTPLADFGPLALRAVRDEMVKANLARTTINARINRIRRVFRWAASVELVPAPVVQGLATLAGLQCGRTRPPSRRGWGPSPSSTSRPPYASCRGRSPRWSGSRS